jgi:hypothetical protein
MSSEVKANKISPATGTAFTFGDSGDTFTVPSGATITNSGTATGFASGLASVQTFTSSGTWTRPSDITKVIMEVQGAGGSGSNWSNNDYVQAGSGGGYAKKLLDVSSISTSTITVGAGGAAQASATTAGSNGGLSSWADGTNTITGSGGTGGTASGGNTDIAGGAATGGDINIPGAIGGGGNNGDGASHGSMFGFGSQRGWTGESHLPNAVGYGGGGAGGYSITSGSGGGGIIIVWEYK